MLMIVSKLYNKRLHEEKKNRLEFPFYGVKVKLSNQKKKSKGKVRGRRVFPFPVLSSLLYS